MAELNVSAFVPTHTAPPVLRSDDVQVRWVMPEIYHDLPIHEADDDEAIRLLEELVDKALPGAGRTRRPSSGSSAHSASTTCWPPEPSTPRSV